MHTILFLNATRSDVLIDLNHIVCLSEHELFAALGGRTLRPKYALLSEETGYPSSSAPTALLVVEQGQNSPGGILYSAPSLLIIITTDVSILGWGAHCSPNPRPEGTTDHLVRHSGTLCKTWGKLALKIRVHKSQPAEQGAI